VPATPLLSFTEFLLETVERDALPVFELLRQRYEIYLSQDPAFESVRPAVAINCPGVVHSFKFLNN
jgi:golgi to ER traffic protein 4